MKRDPRQPLLIEAPSCSVADAVKTSLIGFALRQQLRAAKRKRWRTKTPAIPETTDPQQCQLFVGPMIQQIYVDRFLFALVSERSWIESANRLFLREGVTMSDVVCIASDGRICTTGMDFRQARTRRAYPVMVYAIRQGLASTVNSELPEATNKEPRK